jgi:hypothetical protein
MLLTFGGICRRGALRMRAAAAMAAGLPRAAGGGARQGWKHRRRRAAVRSRRACSSLAAPSRPGELRERPAAATRCWRRLWPRRLRRLRWLVRRRRIVLWLLRKIQRLATRTARVAGATAAAAGAAACVLPPPPTRTRRTGGGGREAHREGCGCRRGCCCCCREWRTPRCTTRGRRVGAAAATARRRPMHSSQPLARHLRTIGGRRLAPWRMPPLTHRGAAAATACAAAGCASADRLFPAAMPVPTTAVLIDIVSGVGTSSTTTCACHRLAILSCIRQTAAAAAPARGWHTGTAMRGVT